jgi:phytoene dehydrogenase-like protein
VWLDPALARGVGHVRSRGVAARVSLQLDRAPGFTNLVLAPSLDYLERAYDDAKHGRMSQRPWLEARCDAGHRVDVHVQYLPEGAGHEALGDVVAAMLSEHLGDAVITTPRLLASREPAPPAELTLDQALWMRPHPELAHYRTPIEGLWLCGPAMHPGHGIVGAAGYNAARALLSTKRGS